MPLSLTINGIDGFKSGKWIASLNSDIVVLSNREIQVNAKSQYAGYTSEKYPVTPNTTYVLSAAKVEGTGAYLGANFYDSKNNLLGTNNGSNNALFYSFTTPSNCYFISVGCGSRTTSVPAICSFKDIVLNLGTIPAPYEPKRGDIMVMPVPKKNLLAKDITDWTDGWGGSLSTFQKIDDFMRITLNTSKQTSSGVQSDSVNKFHIEKGKYYTLSFLARANRNGVVVGYCYLMNGLPNANKTFGTGINPTMTTEWKRYSINVMSENTTDNAFLLVGIFGDETINKNGDYVDFKEVQLEEGTTATPYEPYAVQINEKPQENKLRKSKRVLQSKRVLETFR